MNSGQIALLFSLFSREVTPPPFSFQCSAFLEAWFSADPILDNQNKISGEKKLVFLTLAWTKLSLMPSWIWITRSAKDLLPMRRFCGDLGIKFLKKTECLNSRLYSRNLNPDATADHREYKEVQKYSKMYFHHLIIRKYT